MLLTLASGFFMLTVFIGSFGMASRSFAGLLLNMDVTVASRLSAHHLKPEDHQQVNKQSFH